MNLSTADARATRASRSSSSPAKGGRFNSDWVIDEFTRPHWMTTQRGVTAWPF